jgi:hypothetical protein
VDRGRRIGVHYAGAIATGGTGACDGPEPIRATHSSASVAVAVTVVGVAAAKRDLPYFSGIGSVRAFLAVSMWAQLDRKPIMPPRLSEGERVTVNGQYTLRPDRRVTANKPPASAIADRSRPS